MQCQAITQKGTQCSRSAKVSNYCSQHTNKEAETKTEIKISETINSESIFTLEDLVPTVGQIDSATVGKYLLVGGYPGDLDPKIHRQKISDLYNAGVRTWITLQTESELKSMNSYQDDINKLTDTKYLQLPIVDRKVVEDKIILSYLEIIQTAILEAKNNNSLVYLHCKGGHGRSGTITTLLIAKNLSITTTEALRIWYTLHDIRKNNAKNTRHRGRLTAIQIKQLSRLETYFLDTK